MGKDLLLVIDMQNAYGKGGQWYCPNVETAEKKIKGLLQDAEVLALDVILTQFFAPKDPVGTWKKYNEENAQVNEDVYANALMEAFLEAGEIYPLYAKSTYSAMTVPEIVKAVKKADRVLVSGVVAECCVLATAMAAIDAGAEVIYLTDGVAGIGEETEKAVETVLAGLEPLHVRRMTVDEYRKERGERL